MKLNPEQQQIVSGKGHMVAVAAPGSGKTRVIVERAKRLLKEGEGKIYLVTFTRAAAVEMQKRIGRSAGSRITAATFDSYCLRMARAAGYEVTPPSNIHTHIARHRTREFLGDDYGIEEIEELLAEAGPRMEPEKTPNKLAALAYETYRAELQRQHVKDFASIARAVTKHIQKKEGKVKPLPAAHLLVDEFQDSDEIQLEWVLAHARTGSEILVVGDDDQAIYSWRGGLGYGAMKAVEKELGAKVVNLDTCYRCRPEVIEHARLLIANNQERFNKATRTVRPCGGKVEWWRADSPGVAASAIKAYLKEAGWPRFAILARRNRDLDQMEESMLATGRKIVRIGGQSLWAKAGAQAVLALADFIVNPAKPGGLNAAMEWMKIERGQQAGIRAAVAAGERLEGERIGEQEELPTQLVDLINDCIKALKAGKVDEVANNIHTFVLDNESREWATHKAGTAAAKVIRHRAKDHPGASLVEIVRALQMAGAKGKPGAEGDADGVLATMHASKGLEWPVVFIVAANEGITPNPRAEPAQSGNDTSLMEEERRLFFVAQTRAEDEVHVISYFADEKGNMLVPSPFIAEAQIRSTTLIEARRRTAG